LGLEKNKEYDFHVNKVQLFKPHIDK